MIRRTATPTVLLAICVLAFGVADYVSGPEIGFSLFYLGPIVWAAWRLDQSRGLALAGLAAALWFAADAAWNGVTLITLWNAFTRLGIYVAIAFLTARVRYDQRRLEALNARLQELLQEEQQLARTDSLTGLPNRRLFTDELRRTIGRSRRTRTPVAVAYLDLNHFKRLNDSVGHPAGDAVLRGIGQVLGRYVRGNDVAARLGGDEFAVLLDACSIENARLTGERLLEHVGRVLAEADGGGLGISIGIACFDVPPAEPDSVIDHADAAMYCAKAKGTGNHLYVCHYPAGADIAPTGPRGV